MKKLSFFLIAISIIALISCNSGQPTNEVKSDSTSVAVDSTKTDSCLVKKDTCVVKDTCAKKVVTKK